MKPLVVVVFSSALLFSVSASWAQERNKAASGSPSDALVTLKGKITCAKSELNDTPTCHTVIVVRDPTVKSNENDRDIVYYFDAVSSKKYHQQVCEQGVNGTVEGIVTEKDDVKMIKVVKLTFKGQNALK